MIIAYEKINFLELERIYSLHSANFDIICDGDRKVIILERYEEEI